LDDTYDLTKMLNFKRVPIWYRMLLRLTVPLMLPFIFFDSAFIKSDRNPLHDGKRKLTGKKQVAISDLLSFDQIKKASRDLEITINELMCAALSTSVADLFEQMGDSKTKSI